MIHGHLHPAFNEVGVALRRQLESSGGGAAISIYHRGKCEVDIWGGKRNTEGAPWEQDTIAPSFSTTKGVASTVLHVLADQGLIDYDERVCTYWPEFGQAGKEHITVRQVLAHQSGLYHVRRMVDHADRMLDWDYMIKAIEKTPPLHKPGTRMGYHGLTYGYLVGEIIERATDKPFRDVVEEVLTQPLGLDGLYIGGVPKSELGRVAQLIGPDGGRHKGLEFGQTMRGPAKVLQRMLDHICFNVEIASILDIVPHGISTIDFSSDDVLTAPNPSINGLFTARSLARVYAILAGEGELEGQRVLSKKTFLCLSEIQPLTNAPRWMPKIWRLGYHRIGTLSGFLPNAFGHFGFAGSGAWADPSRELSLAMIVNTGRALMDTRILRIGAATVRAADARASVDQGS